MFVSGGRSEGAGSWKEPEATDATDCAAGWPGSWKEPEATDATDCAAGWPGSGPALKFVRNAVECAGDWLHSFQTCQIAPL
jgi:hypothetical protein